LALGVKYYIWQSVGDYMMVLTGLDDTEASYSPVGVDGKLPPDSMAFEAKKAMHTIWLLKTMSDEVLSIFFAGENDAKSIAAVAGKRLRSIKR